MKKNNYLSESKLQYFLCHLKKYFGYKDNLDEITTALDDFILNIDYEYCSNLGFNTSQIVTDLNSSSTLGFGSLGVMTLGKSYDGLTPELGICQLGKMILKDS